MNLRFLWVLHILITLLSIQCSPSLPFIGIDSTFNFAHSKTIAVYISPSGRDAVDDHLRNLVDLGFISRGYRVVNIFPKAVPSLASKWSGHQATAETLIQRTIAHSAELVAIVHPQFDSVQVVWAAKMSGYYYKNSFLMQVEMTVFDKKSGKTVAANQSIDTMRMYQEHAQVGTGEHYHEPLYVLMERSLTKVFGDFPFCSLEFANPPSFHFPLVLLVDKSYRNLFSDWKTRLERRMIYVNDMFRNQFDMQFDVRQYREWNSEFTLSLEYEIEQLRYTTGENDTLYLGITNDPLLALNWTQHSRVGLAYCLGTQAVITAQPAFPDANQWNSVEEAVTIVHELGHVFGAPHILNESSVMYPQIGAMSYLFDPYTQVIIESTRRDFLLLKQKDRLEKYIGTIVDVYNNIPSQQAEIIQPLGRMIEGLIRANSTVKSANTDTVACVFRSVSDTSLSYATVGYLAFRKHHWGEAIASFMRSIEFRPDFSEALWYVGRCYLATGDKTRAEAFFDRAKEYGVNWALDN